MFKCVETLQCVLEEERLIFKEGRRTWTLNNSTEPVTESFKILVSGKPFNNLPSQKLLAFLQSEKLVFRIQNFDSGMHNRTLHWLAYQEEDAAEQFRQFQTKTVAILGCGGTGGIIAEQLVRAGVERLVLVDGACVDLPDLNRQLQFTSKDIGHQKVIALKTRLLEINPNVEVQVQHQQIVMSSQVVSILSGKKLDLIVCALDQPMYEIQAECGQAALDLEVPILYGAVGITDALIGPLFTETEALSKAIASFRVHRRSLRDHQSVIRGSLCFTNAIAASYLALEAFRFLCMGKPSTDLNKPTIIRF